MSYKLDPWIKEQWLQALRSGQYTQGTGALKRPALLPEERIEGDNPAERFCCLGVLCDVYARTHPKARWKYNYGEPGETFRPTGEDYEHTSATQLPAEVARWAFGLTKNFVYVPSDYEDPKCGEHTLSKWNDGWVDAHHSYADRREAVHESAPFARIAMLIEQHL